MTPEQVLAAWETTTTPQQDSTKRSLSIEAQPFPSFPAGLTVRELEVLRLVAQGLTNPQIAQQLILSPNTVHTHVRSILKKLGVSSRGALVHFALEHHLECGNTLFAKRSRVQAYAPDQCMPILSSPHFTPSFEPFVSSIKSMLMAHFTVTHPF